MFATPVDILEIFVEAQSIVRLWDGEISRWIWVTHRRRETARDRWENRSTEAKLKRREYASTKQAEYYAKPTFFLRRRIREKLLAGERPKRWGAMWRQIADELGISYQLSRSSLNRLGRAT